MTELKITLENYQKESSTFASKIDYERSIGHYFLGMVEEEDEYFGALANNDYINAIEEMGDRTWFASKACGLFEDFNELSFQELLLKYINFELNREPYNVRIYETKEMLVHLKRVLGGYNDLKDIEYFRGILHTLVSDIANDIVHFSKTVDWSKELNVNADNSDLFSNNGLLTIILNTNYNKLYARNKGKNFNKETTVNRDTENERSVMEQSIKNN